MAMKLLPKSEIFRQKAAERRREVEEGAKLARRVDNLREVAAQEDASLQAWRKKTLKTIQDDILQATQDRDAIKAEVEHLKSVREEAKKPLDAELERVAEAQKELAEREERVNEAETTLAKHRKRITLTEQQANALLTRAQTKEGLADVRLREADRDAKDAERTLTSARKAKEDAMELKDKTEKLAHSRDIFNSARERDIAVREKQQQEERAKINKEWVLLNDRKRMFDKITKASKASI